jgi:hypothetical protein
MEVPHCFQAVFTKMRMNKSLDARKVAVEGQEECGVANKDAGSYTFLAVAGKSHCGQMIFHVLEVHWLVGAPDIVSAEQVVPCKHIFFVDLLPYLNRQLHESPELGLVVVVLRAGELAAGRSAIDFSGHDG